MPMGQPESFITIPRFKVYDDNMRLFAFFDFVEGEINKLIEKDVVVMLMTLYIGNKFVLARPISCGVLEHFLKNLRI